MGKGSKRRPENTEAVTANWLPSQGVKCSVCGRKPAKLYWPGPVCEECR